jgi:hypothetical protein
MRAAFSRICRFADRKADSFPNQHSLPQPSDYGTYLDLYQVTPSTGALLQESSTNAFRSQQQDDSFAGSMIVPTNPQASAVMSYGISQGPVPLDQHNNLPTNGFETVWGAEMTELPRPSRDQTRQISNSLSEPILDGQDPQFQLSPGDQLAIPPRGARKQMRRDPTPNEQGQYPCTYEECQKENKIFRLPCHWQ